MLGTHDNVLLLRLQPQRQDRLPGKRCERDREREQEREVATPQASTKQDRDRGKSFREPRLSCWGWLPGTLSESFLPGFLELCKKHSRAFGKSVSESVPKVSLHSLGGSGTQTWSLVTLDDLRYALDYAAAADMFDQAMLPELSVSDRLF